jgi:hypothetical protein
VATPSLFDRIAAALFGGAPRAGDTEAERALVADLIEAVVGDVEPRVRHCSGYQGKLEDCIRHSIAYLRSIGRGLEPVPLTRAAWSGDPRVNAFFARAEDVPACLGRSAELRAFFEDPANGEVQEAYALLGMKKEERSVLGMELKGETVQHDVAQVVVSFSGHRLVAPRATLAAARLEIGRRIILRLAQVALGRIIALDTKAADLQEHKAYLGARLRMLNLARDGMEGIVKDPAVIAEEIKAVERELKQTVGDFIEAKSSLATLDGYIEQIREVFGYPERHLALTLSPLRLSRMGVKIEDASAAAANELSLAELTIGADWHAAIAIVRCPRAELPPKEDLIANAERYL